MRHGRGSIPRQTFRKCVKMTGSWKSFSVVQEMLYFTVDIPVATYVAALYVRGLQPVPTSELLKA
jgi:hypothetical protein